jgi:hypothetical protein
VDEQDHIQRALYPSIGGRSRLEAYPGLNHSGKLYKPKEEVARWDMERLLGHLAGYVGVRHIDSCGMVSLYNSNRYVSQALKGKEVYVTLDPIAVEWVFSG